MKNKTVKLIVVLSLYTVLVVLVTLFLLHRNKIGDIGNKENINLQNELQDKSIVNENKNNPQSDNGIEENEKEPENKYTIKEEAQNDLETSSNITWDSTNKYDDIDLLDVSTFDENIRNDNQEIFKKYAEFVEAVHKGEGVKYSILNLDYIKTLYDKSIYFGDSNVIRFADQRILPKGNVIGFRGLALRELYNLVEDVDLRGYDNIILWTGFVIKYIKDANHYISEYERVIKKIRDQNKTANIYICSLIPATKEKLEEDLRKGSPHNIYMGPMLDDALVEHFKDNYINTKMFVDESMYIEDGYHMAYEFYQLMTAYVGFYINFMSLKS